MKLLDEFTALARRLRLARNTIDVYRSWVRQFVTFSALHHRAWESVEVPFSAFSTEFRAVAI